MEQNIVDIVVEGFKQELSDDTIMEQLYSAGVKFADLKKTFNQIVADNKLRMSPAERKEKIFAMMETVSEIKDGDHLKAIAESISKKLSISMKQTMAGIRGYAGDKGITLPKPTRKPRGGQGFTKNYKVLTDYMLQNKTATREELIQFAKDSIPVTKSGNDKSANYANHVWNMVLFAKEFSVE